MSKNSEMPNIQVYLDHAATTPMLPAAIEAVTRLFAIVGNAASIHEAGRSARRSIEESRELIADYLHARPSEVIFTSGGTESNNLATKGIYWAVTQANPHRNRILVSPIEHNAILDPIQWLADYQGAKITWLSVCSDGKITADALREAIEQDPENIAFVTAMWANNEIGTVTDIASLVQVAEEYQLPFHTDAIQAVGACAVDFSLPGLSSLSVTAHKFGGPEGIGALLLRRDTPCVALHHGGGHELNLRSGSQNTQGIVGMAAAIADLSQHHNERVHRLVQLRDSLIDGIRKIDTTAQFNGPLGADRLPGNVHVSFPGCQGDSLLFLLDTLGVSCSTGSACSAGISKVSHVLTGIGADPTIVQGSLRFSLGHTTTQADVDYVLQVLPQVLEQARDAGFVSG